MRCGRIGPVLALLLGLVPAVAAQSQKPDTCGLDVVLIPSVPTRLDAEATRLASLRIIDQGEYEELVAARDSGRPLPIVEDLLEAHSTWDDFSAAATEELRAKAWPHGVQTTIGMLQQCVPPEALAAWAQRRSECVAARKGFDMWVTAVDDESVTVACWWLPEVADRGADVTGSSVTGGFRDDGSVPNQKAFRPDTVIPPGRIEEIRFYRTPQQDFELSVSVNRTDSAAVSVPWIDAPLDLSVIKQAPVRGVRIRFEALKLSMCAACETESGAVFNLSAIAKGISENRREARRKFGDISRQMYSLPPMTSAGNHSIDKVMLVEVRQYDQQILIEGTLHATTDGYSTRPPTPFEIRLERVKDRWVVPRNAAVGNLSGSADGRVRWRGTLEYSVEYLRF